MKLFRSLKQKATSYLDVYKQRDPASYAAAEQAIGGVLVLDGLVGIDNPLAGSRRPGIFGTVASGAVGIVFLFVPLFLNGFLGLGNMTATTQATITAVGQPTSIQTPNNSGSSSSSSSACSLNVRYMVNGNTYERRSQSSSGNYCNLAVGNQIPISYNPSDPTQWGYNIGTLKFIGTVFFVIGLLVILSSLVTFIIRLLSIIFGAKLIFAGRSLAKTIPGGVNFDALVSEIKRDFTTFVFGGTPAAFQPVPVAAQPVAMAGPSPVASPEPQVGVPVQPVPVSQAEQPAQQTPPPSYPQQQ